MSYPKFREFEISQLMEDLYDDEIIDAYDPCIRLFYYEDENRFYDECGFPVDNIQEYVTPNELYLFFMLGRARFPRPNSVDIELLIPENIYD